MNESTSRSNRAMWTALIVVAVASTATAFYWLSSDDGLKREFASGDPDRVRAALTSAERGDMDTETRKIAADAMRNMSTEEMMKLMDRDDISEEDRRRLRRNIGTIWRGEMLDRAEQYYAAETEEEKNAVLDKQIDQFQKFRERMEQIRKQREEDGEDDEEAQKERENRWRNRPVQTTEQKKERMAARSPEQSAKMMNMFMAMRNRASQRGIEMGGFGRGGRGRGGPGRGGRGGGRAGGGGGGRGGSSGR